MKIRELLSDASKWTKYQSARDQSGNPCPVKSEQAVCFCLIGALNKCYGKEQEVRNQMYHNLMKEIMPQALGVASWNDDPARTFEEVKQLVDKLDI